MLATRTLSPEDALNSVNLGEDPLSVAYLSSGWPPASFASGIVTYIDAIAEGMHRLGHQTHILAQRLGDGERLDPDRVHDVCPDRVPLPFPGRVVHALLSRLTPETQRDRRVCEVLRSVTRRLVANNGLSVLELEESFGWARLLNGRIPVPVVVRLHGPRFLVGEGSGITRGVAEERRIRLEGQAILEAAGVSAPSRFVLERTKDRYGPPAGETAVIPNPMPIAPEADRWQSTACEPNSILFVGRFDRLKGADLVVSAYARLREEFPRLRLRLRIAGPDTGLIDDQGRRWEAPAYLADRVPEALGAGDVDWLGRRPPAELRSLRRQAAITVIASRYETFPMAVLEGMAQGCPLVAPSVGGIPEMIQDGVNGLLFRVGDAADLAAQLRHLLTVEELASRLGDQAVRDCERRYDPDTLAAQTVEFYRSVIARGISTTRRRR